MHGRVDADAEPDVDFNLGFGRVGLGVSVSFGQEMTCLLYCILIG